ncbi:hypothetical protein FFF34_008995 [Inquilinus sp. KBS0705]|nr:hypothetical protein FFF34_008995 [Inquilinus sp. KBS0705]
MDEQFDNKLTDHIRDVFENFEHPGADEGWMKLREKFPAQQSRNKVVWLWWGSAAAVLLVFLGVGLWYDNKPTKNNDVVAAKPAVKPQPNKADTVTNATNSIALNSAPATNNSAKQNGALSAKPYASPAGKNTHTNFGPANTYIPVTPTKAYTAAVLPKNNTAAGVTNPVDTQKTTTTLPVTTPQIAKAEPHKVDNTSAQVIAAQPPLTDNKTNSMAAARQSTKTITQLLAEEQAQQPYKKQASNKQDTRKVAFSVYAATYFNYAEGSKNQMNAGAGFTSDIKLTKNLKLSTGLALAQNTLSYDNTPPVTNGVALVASAPAQIRSDGLFAVSAAVPQFRNYNASLVGLDIPVNIKYEFNPQKSDTYISAGLSSGTFIDERYTYTYNYTYTSADANKNIITTASTTTENETTRKSFNNFYFGKTLNIAFGVGVPVGKSNRLIFEPFLKYPLGGLGTQQINFGAGGLNLKFNFKGVKK